MSLLCADSTRMVNQGVNQTVEEGYILLPFSRRSVDHSAGPSLSDPLHLGVSFYIIHHVLKVTQRMREQRQKSCH